MDRSNHATTDINELETRIKSKFETLIPLCEDRCIRRVLPGKRRLNEGLYTPQSVSIGPFHYGRPELSIMEDYKRIYLQDLLQGTQVSLMDLLSFVKDKESLLRDCYAETIQLKSDEFVEMMLTDAAFVIELLLKVSEPFGPLTMTLMSNVFGDMFLLENQLPMFLLDELFNLTKKATDTRSMAELIMGFGRVISFILLIDVDMIKLHFVNAKHFVHLLILCLEPQELHPEGVLDLTTRPNVTALHLAGVKFKINPSRHLPDIKFENGILEIPKIRVYDQTECIIKNMQMFEQMHCSSNHLNDYIVMINYLVNTPKDVELLIQNGVIENCAWNKEAVSTVFNNLGKAGIFYPQKFNYSSVIKDLKAYCNSPWNKWKANLKQNYFNTPWASLSVVAAVLLLLLTCIQTICSIISV